MRKCNINKGRNFSIHNKQAGIGVAGVHWAGSWEAVV